jgi:PBP1b-binding outer membrane lipoprotein LpoB
MKRWTYVALTGLAAAGIAGCSHPKVSTHNQVPPDKEIIAGGLGSGDIRTVAAQMTPAILALPEIAQQEGVTRIAISPMKNSSRFIVDMNIFMKKLRLELNRYGSGQLRFFSQDNAGATRTTMLKNRTEEEVQEQLELVADKLLASPTIANASEPVTISVIPAINANLVNMNADSFTAMLRSKIAEKGAGKVQFTAPGSVKGADYLLTGQFIADTMKQEGIVNLPDYMAMMKDRMEKGESLDLYDKSPAAIDGSNSGNQVNIVNGWVREYNPSLFRQIQLSGELRQAPNVTKKLNVMLLNPETDVAVFENIFTIEQKITDGTEKAAYILSGEISGLSKQSGGTQSDYLLITMQLVDPETNELLWEDGYEVKRSSVSGTVYQ